MPNYEKAYRENSSYFGADQVELLGKYQHLLPQGGRVLDVGIGQGRNSLPLAELGHDVHGIDLSTAAIAAAAAQAEKRGVSLTLWQGSFADYEPGCQFDAVLLFGLLQELSPTQRSSLVSRMAQWSAPGALLFAVTWHADDPMIPELSQDCEQVGVHCYRLASGELRTFLEPGEICAVFADWQVVCHWEGFGAEHHHGDGKLERHSRVEFVGRFRAPP